MKSLVPKSQKNRLQVALLQAHGLQFNYNKLKSPSTQNVRNPFPMWALVQCAMPNLPKESKLITVNVTRTAIIGGKRIVQSSTEEIPAIKMLGTAAYDNAGITIDELVESIRNAGYIARRSTVAVAVNALMAQGIIARTRHTRKSKTPKRKGKVSFCKYFVQQV